MDPSTGNDIPPPWDATWGSRIKHYILTGLFFTIPVGVTFYIFAWFVAFVDGSISPPLEALMGRHIPGLGLLTAAVVIIGTGFLASLVVGQHLLEFAELRGADCFPQRYGPRGDLF